MWRESVNENANTGGECCDNFVRHQACSAVSLSTKISRRCPASVRDLALYQKVEIYLKKATSRSGSGRALYGNLSREICVQAGPQCSSSSARRWHRCASSWPGGGRAARGHVPHFVFLHAISLTGEAHRRRVWAGL